MENPLLSPSLLPRFSSILPEHIEPALKQVISENRNKLNEILSQEGPFTWDNLMAPVEEMNDRLSKMWSPVSHMHAVVETEGLRAAYKACLPLLTEYNTELMQNEKLYKAIRSIADSSDYANLNAAQRKVIQNELRDFKLAGVSLPPAEKARFGELQKKLSHLTTQFAEHLLDATHAWTLHVTDRNALKGLPEEVLAAAQQAAQEGGKTGWVFTLEYPVYAAVMKYLDNRELRWLMYEAYTTRASDQGPHAGQWDNSLVMEEILKLRHELANLLGFKNFAEYSLATKMADSPKRVMGFLNDLVEKSKAFGEKEIQELYAFAKQRDGVTEVEAWDLPFYSEKMREANYSLSQEDLRPYFPAYKALEGMFAVVNKLYGLRIVERKEVDTWHPQVQFFEVYDEKNNLRGYFYTDLYARPHKRDGAWMDDCRMRRRLADGSIQYPVAFLTCNFNRPLGNKPALLTHDEVLTLFHEFGHCMHHMLTQVDYAGVSGINGVAWDAVEFPSQFFEFWCWNKEALALISGHYETGESLPDALYNKLIATQNFQSGMQMLRQLEFAVFDFRVHLEYDPKQGGRIQQILDEVRSQIAVVKTPVFNRFQNSFSHVFAGGYAAGYYSYKWAEVLSSDAFSKFEEKGVFDEATGREFLHNILEQGGTREPMELFVAFRGREPSIEPLLRHSGLIASQE
ncbi:MAG: oligopeptidase A [Gammaproteobacteria bacterium]